MRAPGDLMNIPINSASKKDETLFDAPLSSYTITRADMLQSGVTSIPEALRLAPGVIVREQSNGNYDIHIRGFDNILRSTGPINKGSMSTLVMIDNRPVFNHNLGGTAWETLPVEINDIERIEIVRGPSAPLFGPNAVSGVINIITRNVTKDKHAYATVQYGTPGTLIGQASFGKQITNRLAITGSANYQERERFQREYYNPQTNSYENFSNHPVHQNRYPNMDRALQKWGANAFINYKVNKDVNFDFTLGLQQSEAQKVMLAPLSIPLSTNLAKTEYINLAAHIHGIAIRTSFLNGVDELGVGYTPNGYDYQNFDINAEYPIHITNKIVITPGLAFQNVTYSDKGYTVPGDFRTGYMNGTFSIATSAAFVRADINVTKNWRFLTAIRADKFSSPDKVTVAYEFASTYKVGDAHLFRAAITRSNTGSFIGQSFSQLDVQVAPGYVMNVRGNSHYNPFTIRMFELGYRVKLSRKIQLDVDLFRQTGNQFGTYLVTEFAPAPAPPFSPAKLQFQNLPTEAVQVGGTISLNVVLGEKIQIKPFITVQETEVTNLPDAFISPDAMPFLTYSSGDHKNTPAFYGGYFINYKLNEKLYFNINGYYFKSHVQYDQADPAGTGIYSNIEGKFLVNAKVNYSPVNKFNVFINARNLFDNDSREFFGTDKTGGLYGIGASYMLN